MLTTDQVILISFVSQNGYFGASEPCSPSVRLGVRPSAPGGGVALPTGSLLPLDNFWTLLTQHTE